MRPVFYTTLGNLAYSFSQWMLVVLLAQVHGLRILGIVALILAITIPLQTLTNLAHRHYQSVHPEGAYSFATFLQVRVVGIFLFALAMAFAGFILDFAEIASLELTAAITVLRISESLSDLSQGAFNRLGRQKQFAISGIVRSMISAFSYVLVIYYFKQVELGILLAGSGVTCFLLCYDYRKVLKLDGHRISDLCQVNLTAVKSLVLTTLPLGVTYTVVMFQPNLPRYFLEIFEGSQVLGVFTALMIFVVLGQFPITAATLVNLRKLSSAHSDGDRARFIRVLLRLMVLAAALGSLGVVFAAFFGERLLGMVFGAAMSIYGNEFVTLMAAGIIFYISSTLGTAATALGKYERMIGLFVLSTLAGGILSAILIQQFGLYGAILGFAASSAINALASCWFLARQSKFR